MALNKLIRNRTTVAKTESGHKPMKWFAMDLHVHTPASSDYQESGISYIEILRRARRAAWT